MDSLQHSKYTASQPYSTNRLPEVRRYVVPPPTLLFGGLKPTFTLTNAASHLDSSTEFGNPAFLRALSGHGVLHINHEALEWKYEHRRIAQAIVPFLLLGPGTAAQDVDFVQEQGITLLVAVRSAFAARMHTRLLNPATFKSGIGLQTLTLDLDSPYDMITKLPRAIKIINDHIEQSCGSIVPKILEEIPARVLVFCESGNDRSATFVTAYLMALYGINAIEAIQVVQAQRFCLAIEDGSKNMLQNFEDILQAKRDVARVNHLDAKLAQLVQLPHDHQYGATSTLGLRKMSKRSYDNANDSDEEMEDSKWDDAERGMEGRSGRAPFQDD